MSFLDALSTRLGVPYRFASLPENCRAYLLDGVAVLNDQLSPEQTHWSYCHEVAHFKLNHHQDLPVDETDERKQEADANRLAADFMLPEAQFKSLSHESLICLKESFPHASYEVLARRRLNFRPGLLTIIDNERITVRLAPEGWNRPPRLFPLESEALKTCLACKEEVVMSRDAMTVEATYVDEGTGVIRVILFLEGKT